MGIAGEHLASGGVLKEEAIGLAAVDEYALVGSVHDLVQLVVSERHLELGPEVAGEGLVVEDEQDGGKEAGAEANENAEGIGAFDKRSQDAKYD